MYHHKEALDTFVKTASEGVHFDLHGELGPAALPDILRAAGALEDGCSLTSVVDAGRGSSKGRRSQRSQRGGGHNGGGRVPKQGKKEDPEWLVAFKKDGLFPLQTARSFAANLLHKVQDAILQFSLCEEEKVPGSDLMNMYVTELQKVASTLEKELETLKRWLLKKGTSPSEDNATTW